MFRRRDRRRFACSPGVPATGVSATGRRACGFVLLAATVCLPIGCGKAFWRQNADAEAYGLAWEKSQDPRWAPPRLDIIPDPRSRFFDPNHPDCEPVPPDDPAANRFMDRMGDFGRIKGDDDWHETYGYTPFIENPLWLERFGLTRAGLNAAWAARGSSDGGEGGVQRASFQTGLIDLDDTAPLRRPSEQNLAVPGAALGGGPLDAGDAAASLVPDEGEFAGLEPTEDVGGSDLDAGNPFLPAVHDLTLPGAIELAYIHNREYQTVLEDVYLAALALSFERFRFDVRFLGLGGNPPGVTFRDEYLRRPQSDTSSITTNVGVSRLLPAGGQWAVELTNNTLYVFGGGADSASASLISYSLVQPLLRGAGRKITLEALTQSERNLLYAVRDLARFRKVFFADAATAGPGGGYLGLLTQVQTINNLRDNIRRTEQLLELRRELDRQRPSVFTVPLARLPEGAIDALDPALLDRPVGEAENPGEAPPTVRDRLLAGEPLQVRLPFAGALNGVARYDAGLGLLQVVGDLTAEEEAALLALSEDPLFRDAAADVVTQIRTDPITLAAAQLESNLVNLITQLRQAEASLQDDLDSYKLYLGLPPDMVVTLDESFLEPFQLIDADLTANERVVEEFVQEWAALNLIGSEQENLAAAEAIPAAAIAEVVRGLAELNERTRVVVRDLAENDLANVRSFEEQRLSELDELQQARFSRDLDRDARTLDTLLRGLDRRADELAQVLEELNAPDVTARTKVRAANLVGLLRQDLLRDARGAEVVQTGLRVEQLALNPFDMPLEAAVQLALENRLDLMNQRAAVTDARRQLELAANALQGVLNLVAEGNVRTQPLFNADGSTNPLDFRVDDSDFNVGVEFDTPLDRVQERNAYRAALIDYQRARRDFIAAEDTVRADVRTAWRQLAVLKQNFETTRQAVRIAAVQFDNAVEQQFAPTGGGGSRNNSQFDLLNALSSLLGSSNDLISNFVNYERARVAIYRDTGLMVVGPEGLWRDEFYLQDELRVITPGRGAPESLEPEIVPSE
ncbi:TolC family protein [Alienimonas californiensis]|uniref:Outer membrane efflux protein n=1 Tax=Alienimonas californiensis TaxID=2527989 RepID=A0A517P4U3_9PLAN|nr:TolC family protein [Alienimonas californiensis]QDT14400.1 Outer membrane efflux protein [Alienimonas californiensis]